MPIFRTATIASVISEREGLQRLAVTMPDGSSARAYSLTQLTGFCDEGDDVVLNTTAVELDLGTGGWHFVHWNLNRREFVAPGPDHIMKIRYTSLQSDVGTDELIDRRCDDPITDVPVIVCSVHSQVAAVAAAFAEKAPGQRLAYVMTDGAALPIALSDLVHSMTTKGLLVGTVTAGHAFGGDLEAVSVPSALGLAVHGLGADAVVVGMGPGVVGTGTTLGTTAVEVAPILDAVDSAGGLPVLCVRASSGDPRGRHSGISHHSFTAARLAHCKPFVAAVPPEAGELDSVRAITWPEPDPVGILQRSQLAVTTMGRTVTEDVMFFAAAAAAGQLGAHILSVGADLFRKQYADERSVASSLAPMDDEFRENS